MKLVYQKSWSRDMFDSRGKVSKPQHISLRVAGPRTGEQEKLCACIFGDEDISVDDLSGALFAQNTRLSGLGAAVATLFPAQER